ncbi:oxysterol-binding protein-related protein 8-like [Actinia tenebrosa]|uniref:Oxysterol-binding protein-related protein 8-like n=1 Tax=Actinia tenebrosa TaxID=6105 RepID=A0A6P8IDQ2_ACTTE|nr:oxysterol-binding protein-related protein 8-like [Actinia tenebrosa]
MEEMDGNIESGSPTIDTEDEDQVFESKCDEYESEDEVENERSTSMEEVQQQNKADTALLNSFSRSRNNDGTTEDKGDGSMSRTHSVPDEGGLNCKPDGVISPRLQAQSSKMADRKDSNKTEKKLSDKSPAMARKQAKESLKVISLIMVILAHQIRGTLKGWAKYWCVVRPGMFIIYKSAKGQWIGTVLLNTCELIERPSKKDGFCFKLYNPFEHYIWATKGPKGELAGAIVQPLPKDHLIMRALTESDGRCWMDALEVGQRQGYNLLRDTKGMNSEFYGKDEENREEREQEPTVPDADDGEDSNDGLEKSDSENEQEGIVELNKHEPEEEEPFEETSYVEEKGEEYLGQEGEAVEEIEDDNKSIIWALLKQLPTFILEPRSFLDKLSDFYYHSYILKKAASEDHAYSRMKEVVRWYLSGFYKKPKVRWDPCGKWMEKHCNSTSAILDGNASLTLLKYGEEYLMDMPYAHCKGILIGTLTFELGGVVTINCEKTGYKAEIEFKLKPFWKKSGESNYISGKIKMGKETLCKIEGKWDGEIVIEDLNIRPWDPMTDLLEYENNGIIKTQYRLKAPMVRTTSVLSVHLPGKKPSKRKRPSSGRSRLGVAKGSRRSSADRSGGSTPDLEGNTSSIEDEYDDVSVKEGVDLATLEKAIQPLRDSQNECVKQMRAIRMDLRKHYTSHQDEIASLQFKDWIVIFLLVVFQGVYQWYMR